MRQLARQERLPRRRADRRIAVVGAEPGALRSQTVDIRSPGHRVAVAAQDVTRMIVRQNKEKIPLPACVYCLRGDPYQEFAASDVSHAQNDIAESVAQLLNDSRCAGADPGSEARALCIVLSNCR